MDAELFDELVELNTELNRLIEEHKIDVGRSGRSKVFLYCECGRSLRVNERGLVCSRHGLQAKVVWADSRIALTPTEIRKLVDEERAA